MPSFAIYIARRYLFAKKSNNIVNIISWISGIGVALGTAALICILSVFNGFEGLMSNMYSAIDPDLKVVVVDGKTINELDPVLRSIKDIKAISVYCETFEENALLEFNGKQVSARIKGVDASFEKLASIDSILWDGSFVLHEGSFYYGVMGIGLANVLGSASNSLDPVYIYSPRRNVNTSQVLLNPQLAFSKSYINMAGVFMVKQPEYDDQYLFIDKTKAQKIFESEGLITGLELRIKDASQIDAVKKEVKQLLGTGFNVLDRREQQEDFFKMIKIEKWVSYLLLCFILVIATFNVISSLSMLIIDKRNDIKILRSMGASYNVIRKIFLFEGWAISIIGTTIGVLFGTLLCLIQQYFGIIHLANTGAAFLIPAYPIEVKLIDIILTSLTVISIGFLAARYPIRYIFKNYIV